MKVYVIKSSYAQASQGWGRRKYHTDPDCPRLRRADRGKSEKELKQVPNYEECKHCAGEWDPSGEYEEKTCSKCGETYKNMADHLMSCDEWS